MSTANLSILVTELINLKRQKAMIEDEIERIQGVFIEAGQKFLKEEGFKTFAGGTFTQTGPDGAVVRVLFPADALIREFRFNGKGQAERTRGQGSKVEVIPMPGLRQAAGDYFDKLFATVHKPAKAFRELAKAMLSAGNQEKIMELVSEPSSPRVTTETGEATS